MHDSSCHGHMMDWYELSICYYRFQLVTCDSPYCDVGMDSIAWNAQITTCESYADHMRAPYSLILILHGGLLFRKDK